MSVWKIFAVVGGGLVGGMLAHKVSTSKADPLFNLPGVGLVDRDTSIGMALGGLAVYLLVK